MAYGEVFLLDNDTSFVIEKKTVANTKAEISRFHDSLEIVKEQIRHLRTKMSLQLSKSDLEIYDAHISILEDPELIDKTKNLISTQSCCADFALHSVAKEYVQLLEQLDDEYLSARAQDIDEVAKDVIKSLQGRLTQGLQLNKPAILVADQISIHQISTIDREFVIGIITSNGGTTDHTSILYNAMGIPAIVGVGTNLNFIKKSVVVLLDAEIGSVTIDPDSKTLEAFQEQCLNYRQTEKDNLKNCHLPAETLSGKKIKVYANIGNFNEAKEAQRRGADGVGLLRTEFCFMDRKTLPSEDEQFNMYKAMLDELSGKEVVIRLIDIGSDKKVPYIGMDEEENPALGTRALRLGFKHYEKLLKPQIRALLRLSSAYNIHLLFPMIATPEDLHEIKAAVRMEMRGLQKEGFKTNSSIPMGIMVEIPNVALMPEKFVEDVDFFSFGTNDLAQYLMAADRTNPSVSDYIPAAVPGILNIIRGVVKVAHAQGKWVGICGGLAADTALTEAFINMGVDELSMPASAIPKIKAFVRKLD